MKRISVSLAALLVTLAAVEAVVVPLELLVPSEFHDRHATLFGLFEPHPELGFRARPNLRDFQVSWRENSLTGTYSTDDFGFRNVGRNYAESEIYFIGDSFTWGAWVPRADTFPDLVGRELGVQISNLGQESYYIEQYHKVARLALGWGRPRRVAVCLFANDLTAPMSDEDFETSTSDSGGTNTAPIRSTRRRSYTKPPVFWKGWRIAPRSHPAGAQQRRLPIWIVE